MKLVYSLNSAPYRNDFRNNFGNWSRPKTEWIVALRSLLANRKYFDHIELVTDATGKQFFEDTGLAEYVDSIILGIHIEKPFEKLWCLGKIQAFALQKETFCHIDLDAWLQKWPSALEHVPVAAQSSESGFGFYEDTWTLARNRSQLPFFRVPRVDFKASNTAFYWCQDMDFNKAYTDIALAMLKEAWFQKEAEKRDSWPMTKLAVLQEQLVFGELHYRMYHNEPTYIMDMKNNGWVHVFGAKNNRAILNTIEKQTRFIAPQACTRIDNYFKAKIYV